MSQRSPEHEERIKLHAELYRRGRCGEISLEELERASKLLVEEHQNWLKQKHKGP